MFVKIIATIIFIMAAISGYVLLFTDFGAYAVVNSSGLVAGVAPFMFMIPVRLRAGSLTSYMATTKEA